MEDAIKTTPQKNLMERSHCFQCKFFRYKTCRYRAGTCQKTGRLIEGRRVSCESFEDGNYNFDD